MKTDDHLNPRDKLPLILKDDLDKMRCVCTEVAGEKVACVKQTDAMKEILSDPNYLWVIDHPM